MVIYDELYDEFHDLDDLKKVMVGVLSGRYLYAHEHAVLALRYAKNFLKRPWPMGEAAISKNVFWSYIYASEVLEARFLAGEPKIASDLQWAKIYSEEFNLILINGVFQPC